MKTLLTAVGDLEFAGADLREFLSPSPSTRIGKPDAEAGLNERKIDTPTRASLGEGSDDGGKRKEKGKGKDEWKRRERGEERLGKEKARGDESNYEKRATRREREKIAGREREETRRKNHILGDVTRKDNATRSPSENTVCVKILQSRKEEHSAHGVGADGDVQ